MTGTSTSEIAVNVLGPLQMTHAGKKVNLGGLQQRAVLAQLLIAGAGGATVDQLADGLWNGRLPAGYVTTIQTYIFHLRKVMEPDRERGQPGRILVSENGRYRLSLPDKDVLDADVFERKVAEGLRLLSAEQPADAAATLADALSLWSGEPVDDLSNYSFVAPYAAHLNERRLTAAVAKVQAEMAMGRHLAVLGELDPLARAHPLDEQVQAQRMLALYRCGRQSDALAVYDSLRHALADGLGVDPSPAMQQLHQRILRQDPTLDWVVAPREQPVLTDQLATLAAGQSMPIQRRHRLRARWLIVGAVLVLVAAAGIVTTVILTNRPESSLAALPANSVGVIGADGSLHDAVPVGDNPDGVAYGFGSLWVANTTDNTVQRVNPRSREVTQTIDVGASPSAIAVSDRDVWVATDHTVTEIDGPTSEPVAKITVGALPAALAVTPAGVWVADSGDDDLQLIDIGLAKVVRKVPVGDGPDGLVADGGTIWVADGRDRTLLHLDATTGQPVSGTVSVGAGAKGLAIAVGSVWVANQAALSVTRIDLVTGRTQAVIPVGDGPNSIVAAHGRIWVSDEYKAAISVIDPGANRVTHTFAIGSSPHGLAVAGTTLWLTSSAYASRSHVGGTLAVESPDPSTDVAGIDPAALYVSDLAMIERAVYDGLVAFRAKGGLDSVGLVPDLATEIPTPTEGGTRYTFTIRPNIRFSSGQTVQASDIRLGLIRELTVGRVSGQPKFYQAIKGASACLANPKHCDLTDGVIVDNANRRITFKLDEPDPTFLYKLTSFVYATPPDAPATESRIPLAGTGPYMISAYKRGSLIELRRNPYFSQWSYAAQPDGYPDVIRYVKAASVDAQIDDVLAGRADVIFHASNAKRFPEMLRRYPDQVRREPVFATQFITLNTQLRPFDDIHVRQALNYAVDRRVVAKLWGGTTAATPTCQILPPGFPGYIYNCPYADQDYTPDLVKAKALVSKSGTAGMTVGVYGPNAGGPFKPVVSYVASVLRELGYHPVVHLIRADQGFEILGNPANKVQVGIGESWNADFPDASTYFDYLFSCASVPDYTENESHYCSPATDRLIAQAKATELVDPAEARILWSDIDRQIVHDSPVIPGIDHVVSTFVSSRVGNYQSSPLDIPVIDQAWVR
jgi:YVTN family beta-propeller protein